MPLSHSCPRTILTIKQGLDCTDGVASTTINGRTQDEDHQMLHETTTGILIIGMLVTGRDGTSIAVMLLTVDWPATTRGKDGWTR